ncbi:MAG TPA: helix-turn-helix transcriptional regulator [Chloroflexia bacterium]|nr:helix-turn-helix transcriptional regulator [Chloroflexia bacterium]
MGLGERLRELRTQKNITASDLARRSGLTKGFVSQVETGRSNPSLQSLQQLATALDVPLAELLTSPAAALPHPTPPQLIRDSGPLRHQPSLSVVERTSTATYLSAVLPAGSVLSGTGSSSQSSRIVCIVRRGSGTVFTESPPMYLSTGDVSSWDPSQDYQLGPSGDLPVDLLLVVPVDVQMPVLNQQRTAGEAKERRASPPRAVGNGPFRLVEMRAERRVGKR